MAERLSDSNVYGLHDVSWNHYHQETPHLSQAPSDLSPPHFCNLFPDQNLTGVCCSVPAEGLSSGKVSKLAIDYDDATKFQAGYTPLWKNLVDSLMNRSDSVYSDYAEESSYGKVHHPSANLISGISSNAMRPPEFASQQQNVQTQKSCDLYGAATLPEAALRCNGPSQQHNSAPGLVQKEMSAHFDFPCSVVINTVDNYEVLNDTNSAAAVRASLDSLVLSATLWTSTEGTESLLRCDASQNNTASIASASSRKDDESLSRISKRENGVKRPSRKHYNTLNRSSRKTIPIIPLIIGKALLPNKKSLKLVENAPQYRDRAIPKPQKTLVQQAIGEFCAIKGRHATKFRQILPEYKALLSRRDVPVERIDKLKFMLKQLKNVLLSWPLFTADFHELQTSGEARSITEDKANVHFETTEEELGIFDFTFDNTISDPSEKPLGLTVCKSKTDLKAVLSFLIERTETVLGETTHANLHYADLHLPIVDRIMEKMFQGFQELLSDIIIFFDSMV
ncbi:hypothetical protein CYMTET_17355 [Cymbomonas tetramitiformis]|uniref:Uncharacterized protein n=1 Tax=Cymbomonas tetramitiformis TaxID=36881 RepID=A0AAE0GA97_9CHLO|nr:hypothetical protein CYMTET_17355 [Cymbomonas tetramitiformis]